MTAIARNFPADAELKRNANSGRNARWSFLLKNMSLWGFNFDGGRCNFYSVVALLIVTIYTFIAMVFFSYQEGTAFDMISNYVEVCVDVMSLYHFRFYRLRILQILTQVMIKASTCKVDKSTIVKILLAWLFGSLIPVIHLAGVIFDLPYSFMPESEFLKPIFNDFEIKVVILVMEACYSFLILIPNCLLVIFVSLICNDITNEFVHLQELIESSGKFSTRDLSYVIKDHFSICETVSSLDDVYSPLVFLWTFLKVLQIVKNVSMFALKTLSFNVVTILTSTSWTVFPLYLLCDFCFCASRISDSSQEISEVVYKKVLNCEDANFRHSAERFSSRCFHQVPCITGWKMFSINRRLVLSIASAILSYALIMYELPKI